jgi:hypothetical protein
MSVLHLTTYDVPAHCADSQLAVSTVRECIGTSQYFSLSPVSFISVLLTRLSPAKQMTENVHTGIQKCGRVVTLLCSLSCLITGCYNNNLPVGMKLQALIVFHIKLSNTDTL